MKKSLVALTIVLAVLCGMLCVACKGSASSISFKEGEASVYLSEGTLYTPEVEILPKSAEYSLAGSNDTIAKVNEDGRSVTLVRAPGIVTLTATSGDKSATQTLKVFSERSQGGGSSEEPTQGGEYYTVVFMTLYGSIPDQQVLPGGKATDPDIESYNSGLMLEGWYSSEDYSQRYDFDTPVNSNLILFSHWIPVASPVFNYEIWNGDLYITGVYYTYIKYTDIYFPETAPEGSMAGKNDVSGVTIYGIYEGAFKGMTSLKTVNIPSTYSEICTEAFSGCTALESITIGESGLMEIGSQAFLDCVALTAFDIPSTVTSIGELAFYNCQSLSDIGSLPTGLKTIEARCFGGTKIASVDISNVEKLCSRCFEKCLYLTTVVGGENATSVGSYTLNDTPYLKNLISHSSDGLAYMGNTLLYYSPKYGVHDITVKATTNLIAGCAIYDGITSDKTFRFSSEVVPVRESYGIIDSDYVELIVPESYYKNYYDAWSLNRYQLYYEDTPKSGLTTRIRNSYTDGSITEKSVAIMKYEGSDEYLDLAALFDQKYQTEDYSYKVCRVNTGAFYGLGESGYNTVGTTLKRIIFPIQTQVLEKSCIAWLNVLDGIEFKGDASKFSTLLEAQTGAIANITKDYRIYVKSSLASTYKNILTSYKTRIVGV